MRAQLRTPSVSKSAVSASVRPSMLASALGAATALEDDAAAALARRRGGIGAVAFTLREAGVKNKDRLAYNFPKRWEMGPEERER